MIPWPGEWDERWGGPFVDPRIVMPIGAQPPWWPRLPPGPVEVYREFLREGMFDDFLRDQRGRRWPPDSHFEFRIKRLGDIYDELHQQWEITLVYLGRGAKGKGKGGGANSRHAWAYGGDNPLEETGTRMQQLRQHPRMDTD